jgi:superfamily II DNA/RNA helicase
VEALAARDIITPFRIQTMVLEDALAGLDVLAKAPTGSGKTLAFGVPVLERTGPEDGTPSALVLVPTRELASQVADELHVLIATPGRLTDLVERRLVNLDRVRTLVLDEADRMLDMGFKPQVERIMRKLPRERQTMLFSATLDGEVGDLARDYTTAASRYEAGAPQEHAQGDIAHRFVSVTADNKVDVLVDELNRDRGLALVFVRTKRGADRLVQKLERKGVRAAALHGDMRQSQREKALAQFDAGKVTTLVATDVAARGLDLDLITHVINFDPPEEDKGYVHRTGRTGRAGRSGEAITLVMPDQQADVSRVAQKLGHSEQFAADGMELARPRLVYTSRRGRRSKW